MLRFAPARIDATLRPPLPFFHAGTRFDPVDPPRGIIIRYATASLRRIGAIVVAASCSSSARSPRPEPSPAPASRGPQARADSAAASPATPAARWPPGNTLLASRTEYQGWRYFHVYCDRCHGQDAVGSSFAPNLRHSVSAAGTVTPDNFRLVVRDGREGHGMPPFRQLLDDSQIDQVYRYIKARSDGRLAAGRPHVAPKPD